MLPSDVAGGNALSGTPNCDESGAAGRSLVDQVSYGDLHKKDPDG